MLELLKKFQDPESKNITQHPKKKNKKPDDLTYSLSVFTTSPNPDDFSISSKEDEKDKPDKTRQSPYVKDIEAKSEDCWDKFRDSFKTRGCEINL